MKKRILSKDELLDAYDQVSILYPYVPPLSLWRAWECAAYKSYNISGRVLDVGCGDGRYFRLLWPQADCVVGVDHDPVVAELALKSGVYQKVHQIAASNIPEESNQFDYVFANCSLEHMDCLNDVLLQIYRCLKVNGKLICSVVTNRFTEWALLPNLLSMAGRIEAAEVVRFNYFKYHHLENPLPVESWVKAFEDAGMRVDEHVPILPLYNSGAFLLIDNLWHINRIQGGELGDLIYPFLIDNKDFPSSFRKIFSGLLDMETNWCDCSGAVFLVSKLE